MSVENVEGRRQYRIYLTETEAETRWKGRDQIVTTANLAEQAVSH